MARRTKEKRSSRAEAKAKDPREVVHKRAYWFDRARSLSELHGWPRAEPGDGRGLVGRYVTAAERPIGQLGCAELHTLLTQGTDPHFLVPVALERLGGGLGIDERALLGDLLRLPRDFWRTHPFLRQALRELATRSSRTLREGEGDDDPLRLAIARFIDRGR
ncbi:MAG: hypothetical protein KC486_00390 [Myxococcales bacterium]|nr:hypothetical protein [Myxococcales bacterium]